MTKRTIALAILFACSFWFPWYFVLTLGICGAVLFPYYYELPVVLFISDVAFGYGRITLFHQHVLTGALIGVVIVHVVEYLKTIIRVSPKK